MLLPLSVCFLRLVEVVTPYAKTSYLVHTFVVFLVLPAVVFWPANAKLPFTLNENIGTINVAIAISYVAIAIRRNVKIRYLILISIRDYIFPMALLAQ